jgi:hypothetical protein
MDARKTTKNTGAKNVPLAALQVSDARGAVDLEVATDHQAAIMFDDIEHVAIRIRKKGQWLPLASIQPNHSSYFLSIDIPKASHCVKRIVQDPESANAPVVKHTQSVPTALIVVLYVRRKAAVCWMRCKSATCKQCVLV